jgi:hypothetical protein
MTFSSDACYSLHHEVHGPQYMMKTRMIGTRIHQMTQAQLLNPTQPLQVWMLEDIENYFVG